MSAEIPSSPSGPPRPSPGRSGGGESDVRATDPAPGAAAEPELPGLIVRIAQLIAAPGELFDGLRRRPVWIAPLLLATALTLATTLIVPEEIFRDMVMSEIPPEADAEDVSRMLPFMMALRYVMSVLGPALLAVLVAGLLALCFNLGLGGEASLRQLFSASTHALLIPAIGGALTLPLVLATGDLRTALALHLLLPGLEESGYLFRLLRGLNIFALWTCAVLGVAVDRLYPRRSATAAAGLLIGLYVAVIAVFAIFGG